MNFTENKILKLAFVISLIIHLLFFYPWQKLSLKENKIDNTKSKPDIIYKPIKIEKNQLYKQKAKEVNSIQKKLNSNKQLQVKKKTFNNKVKQKVVKVDEQEEVSILESKKEKKFDKENQRVPLGIKQVLKQVPAKQRPAFIEYYRFIRNKIEVTAQANRPTHFKEGKVNIVFKLNSDGKLLNMLINEEESTRDRILRINALDSIREASPFPPFPKGLTANELEFRITIEFHI